MVFYDEVGVGFSGGVQRQATRGEGTPLGEALRELGRIRGITTEDRPADDSNIDKMLARWDVDERAKKLADDIIAARPAMSLEVEKQFREETRERMVAQEESRRAALQEGRVREKGAKLAAAKAAVLRAAKNDPNVVVEVAKDGSFNLFLRNEPITAPQKARATEKAFGKKAEHPGQMD